LILVPLGTLIQIH